MSNAATGNQQGQALVFCNGWMPDEGESIQQLFESLEAFAGSLVLAALRQVPFTNPDGSQGVDLHLVREAFPEASCADVDPETAGVVAATQRPWSGAGYATPSGPPGWRSIPSWYLADEAGLQLAGLGLGRRGAGLLARRLLGHPRGDKDDQEASKTRSPRPLTWGVVRAAGDSNPTARSVGWWSTSRTYP